MKKLFTLLLGLGSAVSIFADPDTTPTDNKQMSLAERISSSAKQTEKFQLLLHTKGSLNGEFSDGNFNQAAFKMDQLRVEIKGMFENNIYYRFQQRLTPTDDPLRSYIDNLTLKLDYAGLGYKFNDKWKVFAGKMCAAYGGFQFDDNPINVYQYSSITENMIAFLTGIDFTYNLTPDNEFRFQVLNGRNGDMEYTYGKLPESIKPSKADFLYTLNWNGYFGPERRFATRWSASYLNEAKGQNMYLFCLGTAMNLNKFGVFLDLMYSREGLDRLGIISRIVADETEGFTQTSVDYTAAILGMNYRITPKINLIARGIFDTASKYKTSGIVEKGLYQRVFSYTAGVEYYPFSNENLHLNLVYTGRNYDFTNKSKIFGAENYSQSKVELSFIWSMRVF